MPTVIFSAPFKKSWERINHRHPVMAQQIERKIAHIAAHPEHYKPLRNDLKGLRRVHFGSYVLIYRYAGDEVELLTLDHHDDAYR